MKSKSTLLFFAVLFALTTFLVPASTRAQESRGKISGRVLDPNGAAVPGASVKVTDLGRNQTANLTTNTDGLFEAPLLLPGKYRILVEVQGFKKALKDDVEVRINETTNIDLPLEVGGTQETVTVTSEATTLNASDPNLGSDCRSKARR